MKIMKNAEKLRILGITVNDLKFLFNPELNVVNTPLDKFTYTRSYYSVCIALTGKIIDKGYVSDISNLSINTETYLIEKAYENMSDCFINDWLNAVSDNFVISEDLIKEYEEKQAANEDNNKVIEANDIIKQLKEQNKILKSIDDHLDKLVRKPIK